MYGVKPSKLPGLFEMLAEPDTPFIAIEIKHRAGCPGSSRLDSQGCTCRQVDVTLRARQP